MSFQVCVLARSLAILLTRVPRKVNRPRCCRVQEAELAAQRARLKRALHDALARDPPPQNTKDEWMHGRHAEAIVHLMEFAKGEVGQPHGNALYALLDTEYEVSTEGAARLLKAIGFWPRHVPTVVVRPPPTRH